MIPNSLNWVIALIGLKNHFIRPDEVLDFYYQKRLTPISDELIVDLEVNKDNEAEFLNLLQKVALSFSVEKKIDFESESEASEKIWQLSFLKEIVGSSYSIEAKLLQIENLWARLGYPKEWEDFIYYLPNKKMINMSREGIYQSVLKFLGHNLNS